MINVWSALLLISLGVLIWVTLRYKLWLTGTFVGWAQAVLAGGLLVATVAYSLFTKRQTDATARPFIKANVAFIGPVKALLEIHNTGNGAAHDVKAQWEIANHEREWKIPLLPPGSSHSFPIIVREEGEQPDWVMGLDELDQYIDEHGSTSVIEFHAECDDILNIHHDFDEQVDLENALWGRVDAHERVESEPLDDISGAIGDVANAVGDVSDQIDMEGFSQTVRAQNTKTVVQTLRRHGRIRADHLAGISGISRRNLYNILPKLADADIVEYNGDRNEILYGKGEDIPIVGLVKS